MWECWCECITHRQKALSQPLCPTMSYGCLFFSITRTLFTVEHISCGSMKRILVGLLLSAAGHHPSNDPVPTATATTQKNLPPLLTRFEPNYVRLAFDESVKCFEHTMSKTNYSLKSNLLLCTTRLGETGDLCEQKSGPPACTHLVILRHAKTVLVVQLFVLTQRKKECSG